jgi:ribonuclease VapC
LAILLHDPDGEHFVDLLLAADHVRIGAPTLLELHMAGATHELTDEIDELLDLIGAQVVPFDSEQLKYAIEAFTRFGKGRHSARLNFGDCLSYATARVYGEPLLFKGGDFAKTDITPAEKSAGKSAPHSK